jgi:hypothetical protein
MISFYTLPSTIMSHPTYNSLKAAYSFYNVANTVSWVDLMGDALVLAKKVIKSGTCRKNISFVGLPEQKTPKPPVTEAVFTRVL